MEFCLVASVIGYVCRMHALYDKAASLLKQRQLKDERLLQGAIEDFQPRWSRREYDLSNPDKVMNQDGIQMLPGLVGEDPDSQGRLKKQQEQLREWSVQQQHELATARHQQRLEEQQYDQDRVDLDIQALQLQKIEEESRSPGYKGFQSGKGSREYREAVRKVAAGGGQQDRDPKPASGGAAELSSRRRSSAMIGSV
ncbi:RIB43A-like with coiled-coils protein 2 [Salvelinus alpinus]